MLIALEGTANSGKTETAGRLKGFDKKYEFPDFEGMGGGIIRDITEGRRSAGPRSYAALYAENMQGRRADIEALLNEGMHILCDRYVASNIIYGQLAGHRLDSLLKINEGMPPALHTIYFEGPRHPTANAGWQEADSLLQEAAFALYQPMRRQPGWHTIRYEASESADKIAVRVQAMIDGLIA